MKFEGIIFDLDGTIIDSYPVTIDAFIKVLKKWGKRDFTPDEIYLLLGPSEKKIFSDFVRKDDLEKCFNEYLKMFMDRLDEINLYDGFPDTIIEIKRRNKKIGIFTGRGRELSLFLIKEKGLAEHIDSLVSSEDLKNPKPSPEGVLKLCKELQISPSNVLHVGDSFLDITSGRLAGVVTGGALWGTMSKKKLMEANPDYLFNTPFEILNILTN
ncbi:MAG: HAD-IA family hydrolase [Acidobacteriota bacterium]